MDSIIHAIQWAISSIPNITASVVYILIGLIGIFLLIPGDSPEKQLQAVVDFLSKFSKKKE